MSQLLNSASKIWREPSSAAKQLLVQLALKILFERLRGAPKPDALALCPAYLAHALEACATAQFREATSSSLVALSAVWSKIEASWVPPEDIRQTAQFKHIDGALSRLSRSTTMGGLRVFHELPTWVDTAAINEEIRDELARGACSTLHEAVNLIELAGDDWCVHVREQVSTVVPIHESRPDEHRSFSTPILPGVIFMSVNGDRLRLSEAIIHEAAHNQLHSFEIVQAIVPGGLTNCTLCYSPWRPDPRPVTGVVHGIFVFQQIVEFYSCLEGTNDHERAYIEWRIALISAQLESALSALCGIPLSSLGEFVRDYATKNCRSHFASPSLVEVARTKVAAHRKRFCEENDWRGA
jgi:HEXXH motif-containing protein